MKKLLCTFVFALAVARLFALSGGTDLFGYSWKDSNEPGGPTFNWINIASVDNEIHGLGDDNNRGPFSTSYGGTYNPFTFYWYTVDKFWVGSNGYISFGSINLASIFPTIPDSTDNKHNYIAGILADLTFIGNGNPAKCYYLVTADTIIVSFVGVPFYSSVYPYFSGSNTFQIVLSKVDKSILINFQSSQGTTLNSDIKTGIENITGNIGLMPFIMSYPPANYSIKYTYPAVMTYFVRDGGVKWNTQYGNGGLFLPYPTTFDMKANIANMGNLDIAPVFVATGRVKFPGGQSAVTTAVNFPDTMAWGNDSTFFYPADFIPTATGTYSYTTHLTGVANDAFHSNDSLTQELVVIDTAQTSYELNYTDNVPDFPGISWTDGFGGLAVYLAPPQYPVRIVDTKFYIESNPNGNYFIAKIFDDNGPNGAPGTLLDSVLCTTITTGTYDVVPTVNNISITSGGVYVLWEMYGVGITLARDITPPISLRTYEYVGNLWAEYRNSQDEDFLIGMDVEQTATQDVGVPAIVSPLNNAVITSPTTVTCWLKNHGQTAETNFGVHYKLPFLNAVNETYAGPAIQPGDSVQYTFTAVIQPNTGYSGDFCVWSNMNNDFNLANDTSCITIQTITGISQLQAPGELKVYPNPFDNRTTIEFPNTGNSTYELTIADVLGKTIRKESGISGSKIIIEKQQMLPGIYFIELKGERTFRAKIVVE